MNSYIQNINYIIFTLNILLYLKKHTMKKLVTTSLIFMALSSLSQDRIVLNKNSEVILCEILCITESDYFYKVNKTNKSIETSKVASYILFDYDKRISTLCNGNMEVKKDTTAKVIENYVRPLKTKGKSIILSETDLNNNKNIHYYSGLELQKYTKHHRIGLGLGIFGLGLGALGTNIKANSINATSGTGGNDGKMVLFLGVATAIVGTCFIIEAPNHIKNAGLILSGNGIGVKIQF